MVHQAALAHVQKFDGVFHRDDMILALPIRLIDDRRQGGGFPAAGGSGHQHQTAWQQGQPAHHGRQSQLFRREDFAGNLSKNSSNAVLLPKEIGSIPGEAGDLVSKVQVARFLESLDLVLRCDFIEHGTEVVVVENLELDALELSSNPQHRLLSRNQMKVRGLLFVS